MTTPTIGARIKAARAQLNLTQVQVSKMLGHQTASQVSGWENGTNEPRQSSIDLLEKKLFSKVAKLNTEAEKVAKKEAAPAPAASAKPAVNGMKEALEKTQPFLTSAFYITKNPEVLANVVRLLKAARDHGMNLKELLSLLEGA